VLPAYAGLTAFLTSRRGRTTVAVSATNVRIDERRIWRTRAIAQYAAGDILDVDYAPDPMFASARATAAGVQARRPSMASPPVSETTERVLRFLRAIIRRGGVTITTRRGQTTFAQGLDDRELRYLHFIVRRALSPQP
jgi:hypothetical protein